MAFENFKNNFIKSQQDVQDVVKNALDQILQKEVSLEKQMTQVDNLQVSASGLVFPAGVISYSTGSSINQMMVLDPKFINQFYAWMIADEPAAEIGEEQIEGAKEAFDQVFGQIKIAVADDKANFNIENFQIDIVESGEALSTVLENIPAMYLDYTFSADGKSFKLNYFAWPVPGAESKQDGKTMQEDMGAEQMPNSEMDKVVVQPAEFADLSGSGMDYGSNRNVDMLLDVNLEITVELDHKTMLVSELLKLGKGSIIELEKSAGEPLDIFINGRKFAEGEVVVIDDKFGIRLTQLLSPRDRIKSLGV